MQSAHPIDDKAGAPGTGSEIVAPGTFPVKLNTACAEVLSRMLRGETLTGMEAVFNAGTTRLAAHIGYLEGKYGWRFTRREKVHACTDGRNVTIMTYRLEIDTILLAQEQGAESWCAEVRTARAALRNGAGTTSGAWRRRAVSAHDVLAAADVT